MKTLCSSCTCAVFLCSSEVNTDESSVHTTRRSRKRTAAIECDFQKRIKVLPGAKHDEVLELSSEDDDAFNSDNVWLKTATVVLTTEDKRVLTSGEWLNDRHIQAALTLMKEDQDLLPVDGLQDPLLGENLSFQVCGSEMVQILHSGSSHWITINTVGSNHPQVFVYDSLYTSLPFKTKEQICSLICCNEGEITLKYANVQVLWNDCWCSRLHSK